MSSLPLFSRVPDRTTWRSGVHYVRNGTYSASGYQNDHCIIPTLFVSEQSFALTVS